MTSPATDRFVLPPGEGYVALYLPWDQLRRLAELPSDIAMVRVLPGDMEPVWEREYRREWTMEPPATPFYLLLRHPYFPRVPPNAAYMVMKLEEVIEQYETIKMRIQS